MAVSGCPENVPALLKFLERADDEHKGEEYGRF
jgi:hypothetical protein